MFKHLFNVHEKQFIKAILTVISDKYDIELEEMLSHFNIKQDNSINSILKYLETNDDICYALLDGGKRCSRKSKESNFCMTHSKMYKKDSSSIKIENRTSKIDFAYILQNMKKARKIPALSSTRLLILDSKEYIYDNNTKNVYDFHSYDFIGKLDIFNQIVRV
jgi:hypothetical protein